MQLANVLLPLMRWSLMLVVVVVVVAVDMLVLLRLPS